MPRACGTCGINGCKIFHEIRKCSDCKQFKNKQDFNSNSYHRDGLSSYCTICLNARNKKAYYATKQRIFEAFGNACTCCGETNVEFLQLDHINGKGWAERVKYGNGSLMLKIERDKYPKDKYQILCGNCHNAKTNYGTCPHNKNKH